MSDIDDVRSWLCNTYNIKVSDAWLEACVEWILVENEVMMVDVFKIYEINGFIFKDQGAFLTLVFRSVKLMICP